MLSVFKYRAWRMNAGKTLFARVMEFVPWKSFSRIIAIRQHIKQRANAKGKTLSLFADDEAIGQWRYSALVTDLNLPALQIWRLYRGRADCENRIKELKYDFAA